LIIAALFNIFKGSNDVGENSIKYRTDEMTIKKEVKGEEVAVSLKRETHWSVPPKIPIQHQHIREKTVMKLEIVINIKENI
jgi:hypothetical protein